MQLTDRQPFFLSGHEAVLTSSLKPKFCCRTGNQTRETSDPFPGLFTQIISEPKGVHLEPRFPWNNVPFGCEFLATVIGTLKWVLTYGDPVIWIFRTRTRFR